MLDIVEFVTGIFLIARQDQWAGKAWVQRNIAAYGL